MMLDGTMTRSADGGYAVAFDRLIDRPVAKVWAGLTDPAVLKNWLGDVSIESRLGGDFIIRFREMNVLMTGRITVFEPPRIIEYTWLENCGMPQSLVRWELAPQGDGCRLTLTHCFPPGCRVTDLVPFLGGWEAFLNVLVRGLDGEFVAYAEQDEKTIAAAYRARHAAELDAEDDARASRVLEVRFERVLPGPVERVWEFLTDTTRLPQWFGADSSIEPRPGGRVSLMGGHVRGVVTQWQKPHRLTYTWNVFAPGDPPDAVSAYPESYLTFTLQARGSNEVLLTLHHLPVLDRFEKQNAMGWHTFLDILGAHLRGEDVAARGVYMTKNAARYGVDLDKLAR